MVRVLADPWDPGYGMGFSPEDDLADATIDLGVENVSWALPIPGSEGVPCRVGFVDGVRRVDLRLLLAEGNRRVAGALGSFAVGSAFAGTASGFGEAEVGRIFVAGGGLRPEPFTIRVGSATVCWEPFHAGGEDDVVVQLAIQLEMRRREAEFARRVAPACDLVLVDGPLGFLDPVDVPVAGIIKRTVKRYLEGDPAQLLPMLTPGTRTPLFVLGDPRNGSERFTWYTRIAPVRAAWHDHAGLVRCELSGSHPLDAAVRLANEITALLPRYAGNPADPRTPQNLAPVGGLERRLRHRLGDETLLRRAALAELTRLERSA